MSEPSPTWAVETIKRVANGQRRHPRLWQLVANIQAEAAALVHLIEEPPPGFAGAFDARQVLVRTDVIVDLANQVAGLVTAGEERHAVE